MIYPGGEKFAEMKERYVSRRMGIKIPQLHCDLLSIPYVYRI